MNTFTLVESHWFILQLTPLRTLCFGLSCAILGGVAWHFFCTKIANEAANIIRIWQIRRQNGRVFDKLMAERMALKGKILKVGNIEVLPTGQLYLDDGWGFDCSNGCIPSRIGKDGTYYFCGYSRKELIEIHARRDEYVNRPSA